MLGALLILGLIVRMAWLKSHVLVFNPDGAEYARSAENLLRGAGFNGMWSRPEVIFPPLYPVLIAVVNLPTGNSEMAARLVSVICGVLLVLPIFYLGRKLYGPRTAILAATVVSIHPMLASISVTGFSESTYLLFFAWGLYWSFESLWGRGWKAAAMAGLFWGLAYLARPEAFLLCGVLVAGLLAVELLGKERGKGFWKHAFCAVIAFAIVATPYVIFLRVKTGHFRLEGKSNFNYVVSRRVEEGKDIVEAYYEIDRDLNIVGPGMDPVRFVNYSPYQKHFSELVRVAVRNIPVHLRSIQDFLFSIYSFGSPLLLILVLAGLFRDAWTRDRFWKEIFCLTAAASLFAILFAVQWFEIRFALPMFLVLVIWAAKGMDTLSEWTQQTWGNIRQATERASAGIANKMRVILILAFSGLALAGTIKEPPFPEENESNLPQKEAGLWLRSHFPNQGEKGRVQILSSLGVVAFYAAGEYWPLPYADGPTALRYLEIMAPDFVVLENSKRPYLHDWRMKGIPDHRAELIYRTGGAPENEVIVYAWHKVLSVERP
jgi:4-amino-4-deoxy-L-arabinose transferase-like glycosyltransferase